MAKDQELSTPESFSSRPATLAEALAVLKARHPLSPAELRDIDEAIGCIVAFDGITEEMVEWALDAADGVMIDTRRPWHPSDRASTRDMLEAVIDGMKPMRSRSVALSERTSIKNAAPQGSVEIGGGTPSATPEAPARAASTDKERTATPRTDAAAMRFVVSAGGNSTGIPIDGEWLHADFARQLERELAARNEQLRQSCDEYRAEHGGCCASSALSAGGQIMDENGIPKTGGPDVIPSHDPSAVYGLPITEERIQHIVGERFDPHSENYRKARKAVWACLHEVSRSTHSAIKESISLAILREHWLHQIECNHETKQDMPICACSTVNLGWHPSVGAAVEAWLAHLQEVASPDRGVRGKE